MGRTSRPARLALALFLGVCLALAIPTFAQDDSEPPADADAARDSVEAEEAEAAPPPVAPPTSKPRSAKPKASRGKQEECKFTGNFKKYLSVKEQIIGGSLARLVAQTALHPLDTMRTRRQVRGGLPTSGMDLMKGLLPQMALAMPAGALQFVVMEKTKAKLNVALTNHTLERMKQPVQADMYPNMWVAIAATYKNGGLGGFYTGMAATLMRDVPWNALSFLFVNILKTSYEGFLRKAPSAGDMMAIGATGGALAAIIMTPVDVVKTRLMTQKPDAQGVLPYAGILQCLLKVSGEEGPGALMKGVTPRCLYLGPLSAVVHTIYEKIGKQMLLAKGPNWCHIAAAA